MRTTQEPEHKCTTWNENLCRMDFTHFSTFFELLLWEKRRKTGVELVLLALPLLLTFFLSQALVRFVSLLFLSLQPNSGLRLPVEVVKEVLQRLRGIGRVIVRDANALRTKRIQSSLTRSFGVHDSQRKDLSDCSIAGGGGRRVAVGSTMCVRKPIRVFGEEPQLGEGRGVRLQRDITMRRRSGGADDGEGGRAPWGLFQRLHRLVMSNTRANTLQLCIRSYLLLLLLRPIIGVAHQLSGWDRKEAAFRHRASSCSSTTATAHCATSKVMRCRRVLSCGAALRNVVLHAG